MHAALYPLLLIALLVVESKAQQSAPDATWFEKPPAAGPAAKISTPLRRLVWQVAARGPTRAAVLASGPSALSGRLHRVTDEGLIQCYVEYTDDPATTVAAITAEGGFVELVSAPLNLVQAQIPYDRVSALAKQAVVRRIRLPAYALCRAGAVNTEGDAIHRCNTVRATKGFSGAGIKVGVISDGINGIAMSQVTGDIPATYEALSARADGNLYAGAEGLALLEIVHDLAPGAALAFCNPGTSAEMLSAIAILDAVFGCDILCDDIAFADEPFFEDGPIVSRINDVVGRGALYCSAAGNDADGGYYEGDYAGLTRTIAGQTLNVQDFSGSGDQNMRAQVHGFGQLVVILQWNDPWGASSNDYDLYLTDNAGTVVYSSSTDRQAGSDLPFEIAAYTNTESRAVNVYVVVNKHSGADRRLKIVAWGDGRFTEHATAVGSVFGHAAAATVIACGALPASAPASIEPVSSRGPTRIDFPSIVLRDKPDVCGVDGVSVTGHGGFFSPFFGTSAAAPHVAGVLALIWSADPSMSNGAVRNLVETTAVDLGSRGYDTTYGHGRVDAVNAAASLSACTGTISVSASPAAGGSVSGAGTYPCATTVTVLATPNDGYTFVNWTEGATVVSTSASYAVTVTGDRALVAHFTPAISYLVTTRAMPPDGGTTSGDGAYIAGTNVTVSATPSPGYLFAQWTENGDRITTAGVYTFAVAGDRTLVAEFALAPPAAAPTISPAGGTFTGSVQVALTTSTPGASIRCTTNGATPDEASPRYGGPFTLTSSATVKARAFATGFNPSAVTEAAFVVNPPPPPTRTLTIQVAGAPVIASYTTGAVVEIAAPEAPAGQRFSFWSGDASGTENPIAVIMDRDKTIIANYEPCPVEQTVCGPGVPVCGAAAFLVTAFMKLRPRLSAGALQPADKFRRGRADRQRGGSPSRRRQDHTPRTPTMVCRRLRKHRDTRCEEGMRT